MRVLPRSAVSVSEAVGHPDRVAAAASVERSLPELRPDLDAVARLAAAVIGAPFGAVFLIAPGRQRLAGSNGYPIPDELTVPDERVNCAHVVATDAPLVVRDCATDPRFREHPAVTAGVLRFYAGVPLVDPAGVVVGSVCAIDPRPRPESEPVALASLRDVARQATALLTLHQHRAEQAAQTDVLDAVAAGRPLPETLGRLARHVQSLLGEHLLCSVLVVDEDGTALRTGAGPGLDAGFHAAVDGLPVAEGAGACGTAAHRRQPVVVRDIATDPLCATVRDVTLPRGLAACASVPVLAGDGTALGTFALYRQAPGVPTGREWAVLTSFADITRVAIERDRERRGLIRLATRDTVTDLLNRAAFHSEASTRLVEPAVPGRLHAVLFCDVDRFKLLNDSLGHAAGDEYLRTVAAGLREELRSEDLVCRYAGDAFVVVLPNVTEATARAVAQRLTGTFSAPLDLAGHAVRLSASIGVATSRLSGTRDLDSLLRDADLAMHAAKAAGRNRVQLCDATLRREAANRLDLALAVRDAVRTAAMTAHFQPEFDAHTGDLVGVEALLRWHRPGRGPVSPVEFIPIAEEAGVIADLGRQVLDQACRDLAAWRAQHAAARRITAWVNVSPQQLTDPDFAQTVVAALTRSGLPGAALGLEITESAVMADPAPARATLTTVRQQGVRVAIDDFGTGYSSLALLKTLPVDYVKIDRSFVTGVGLDPADSRLVLAIVSLAHSLGLSVVAEGVETPTQHAELRALGCDVVQGFLLGRPVPAAELTPVLASGRSAHAGDGAATP